jgi:hypothetical protein
VAYLRISDDLPDHPKISRISDGTFRLYINANCWCQKHLTDGKITAASLQDIPRYRANRVEELLAAGLWHREPDGYRVHDFLQHNDSKAEVTARRQRTASRVASWRERHPKPASAEHRDNGNGNALLTADVTVLLTPPLTSPHLIKKEEDPAAGAAVPLPARSAGDLAVVTSSYNQPTIAAMIHRLTPDTAPALPRRRNGNGSS